MLHATHPVGKSADDQDALHRDVRHQAPDRAGRHAVGRPGRARVGGLQCRRAGHPDRPHPADAGGFAQGDQALSRDDRPAVRREPHHPADPGAASLRRIHRRHHRFRHQDRRDGRQQSQAFPAQAQGSGHQGHSQMHLGPPRHLGREGGRRRDLDGWLRMRRPSRRGRRAQPGAAAGGGRRHQDPDDRLRRLRRRTRPGGRTGARLRRHQHGHALHGDQGSADPRQREEGAGRE